VNPRPPELHALHDAATVQARIDVLARALDQDAPRDLLLVVIEEGARYFAEQLQSRLQRAGHDVESRGLRARRSRGTTLVQPELGAFEASAVTDRWVVVVDDIADEGLTMNAVLHILRPARPRSLRTAVLVDKPVNRRSRVRLDYVGFTVPDLWIVGCGMDLDGCHRELEELTYYAPPEE